MSKENNLIAPGLTIKQLRFYRAVLSFQEKALSRKKKLKFKRAKGFLNYLKAKEAISKLSLDDLIKCGFTVTFTHNAEAKWKKLKDEGYAENAAGMKYRVSTYEITLPVTIKPVLPKHSS